jgi:hypothetical protein
MLEKLIKYITPLFLFVAISTNINSQEYVELSKENQHIFSFDIAGGVNRFMFSDVSILTPGGPTIKSKFNFSSAINVDYVNKTNSKFNFGCSIGFSRIGSREIWDYSGEEVLNQDYILDILALRWSINLIKNKWQFSLEPGLGLFLNSKKINYRLDDVTYGEPKWGFRDKWYRFGPNVVFEVSRSIYKGSDPIKDVAVLLRSEYHFATLFFNSSIGVKIKIN